MSLEQTPEEDFTTAFAEFSKPEDKPADEAPVAEAPIETPPAETPPAAETPVETPPAETPPAAETPVETPPAAETPPVAEAPKPAPNADDILSRLDEIVTKTAAAPEPARPAAPAAEETPLYTAEEQEVLNSYEKDWGDVARGEALRRRAENAALVQFVFTEIAKVVTPLRDMTETLAQRTHYADLTQKIGDYDDGLRDQVEQWIGTQPDYLQSAYKQVIDQGTSEQVVDLVARFRKETGSATASPAPAPKGGTELSAPAKQAAAALEPVETKRTAIEQSDDPSNFEAAFGKFAKLLDGQ